MISLPSSLAKAFRPATTHEVHSWSFGEVKSRRAMGSGGWEEQRGTLDDQAIFGPLQDLECACGKYRGLSSRGMICDWCGVKVTSPSVRRERFGHVELVTPIPHPLGASTDVLSAFPVLPAAFFNSIAGRSLIGLYEELVEVTESAKKAASVVSRLVEVLLPVVQLTHEWGVAESSLLARGLALDSSLSLPP